MKIFIPTYGRHDKQNTLNNLPKNLRKNVTLVVQQREAHLYEDFEQELEILPAKIKTITPTRQYILETLMSGGGKFVMLDDDLKFDVRRKDDTSKFRNAHPEEIELLFNKIAKELDNFAHVGVLAREGGNRVTTRFKECTRMMRVLAYDSNVLHKENIKFNRLPLQEDFDVTLQLLRKGYPNRLICDFVQDHGTSNAKGGCSHFRTIEMHNENAKKLAKLHHPFVKVVEKQTKGAWNGQARLDVMVQWKQAYKSSGRE